MVVQIFYRLAALSKEVQIPVVKLSFVFTALCFVLAAPVANSQVQGEVHVKKADFRGQDPGNAIYAALDASEEDVIVVLIRGGSQKLIDKTESNMKALVRSGYGRIGLILADNFPNEKNEVVGIFSGGHVYAVIEDARSSAYDDWAVYNLVKDAYEEDITPKLKNNADSNN